MRHIESGRARAAMAASYQAVTDDVTKLDDDELARPSGCHGWSRGDLLFHMLLDAQRALVAFATPASGEADVDFISYWAPFRPGAEGDAADARFVRRAASSYQSDLVIARLWAEIAAAAAYAAAALAADVKLATQGHALFAGDFLATLAVEATVHHLDLVAGDESLAGPSGPGLTVARETLDGALHDPGHDWAVYRPGHRPGTEHPGPDGQGARRQFGEDFYHGQTGPLPVRQRTDEELTPSQAGFIEAAVALGFKRVHDFNGAEQDGVGGHSLNVVDGIRQNAAMVYLTAECLLALPYATLPRSGQNVSLYVASVFHYDVLSRGSSQ